MHSVCVSSQLLVSVLFIAFPTNTENFQIFITLVCVLFLASMQSYRVIPCQIIKKKDKMLTHPLQSSLNLIQR